MQYAREATGALMVGVLTNESMHVDNERDFPQAKLE